MIEYRGVRYEKAEFDRQFNPRLLATDPDNIQPRRAKLSEDVRARRSHILGVPYGERPRETIDIFPAERPGAPVVVYFHGGYWRTGSARENNFIAEPFAAAGGCVLLVNYDLCPTVSIGHIVAQARRAITWAHEHAEEYGGDGRRLHLLGHSAGAHLIAMALADDDEVPLDAIAGATLVSGIYDLDAVRRAAVNGEIQLSKDDVALHGPLFHAPHAAVPMIIAVGLSESDEWIRQSRLYETVAKDAGCPIDRIDLPGADHYAPLFDLLEPSNALRRAIIACLGR